MPREHANELKNLTTAMRAFIKTSEWENGETRNFFYAGQEKGERMSKAGKPYTQYLFYLIPINNDGTIGEELTLSVFPNQAAAFKNAEISIDYQEIKVTRVLSPGKNGYDQEDWEVVSLKNSLPANQVPPEKEYPPMVAKKNDDVLANMPKSQRAADGTDEINIDDIPF